MKVINEKKVGLLEHLLREGTTPSFSFPLDVCEFRVEGLDDYNPKTWAKMGQDLRKALVEYSPGREVVVNGVKYLIGGACFFNPPNRVHQAQHVFENGLDSVELKWYNRCVEHRCGWVSKKMDGPLDAKSCPVCDGALEPGRWYRPEGFAPILVPYNAQGEQTKGPSANYGRAKWMKAENPRSTTNESARGRIELPAPLLDDESTEIQQEDITDIPGLEDISTRLGIYSSKENLEDASKGVELILINSGFNNRGYLLCPDCGRMEIKNIGKFYRKVGTLTEPGHHRPYAPRVRGLPKDSELRKEAGALCTGTPLGLAEENEGWIMLGMTFKTDVVLFRFNKPTAFIEGKKLSVLREFDGAIRAIKEALIEEVQASKEFVNREIGGGIRKFSIPSDEGPTQFYTDIFLYDEVSGGAGLTTEIIQELKELPEILANVELRLSGKLCIDENGCDMACIGCLLDFRNSQEHNQLDRKNGLRLLRYILYGDLPTVEQGEIELAGPNRTFSAIETSISIDTKLGVETSIDSENHHTLIVKHNDSEMRIRPISGMINPSKDPVLARYNRRDVKEIKLENSLYPPPKDGQIYYLEIEQFSTLRTKVAITIKKILNVDVGL